jgi:hypothetical protein
MTTSSILPETGLGPSIQWFGPPRARANGACCRIWRIKQSGELLGRIEGAAAIPQRLADYMLPPPLPPPPLSCMFPLFSGE